LKDVLLSSSVTKNTVEFRIDAARQARHHRREKFDSHDKAIADVEQDTGKLVRRGRSEIALLKRASSQPISEEKITEPIVSAVRGDYVESTDLRGGNY